MRLRSLLFAAATALAADGGRAAAFEPLGFLEGASFSSPFAVSADGDVVVGESGQAFVWTRARGLEALPLPSEWTFSWSRARALTPDGSTIVGDGVAVLAPLESRRLPIVWRRVGDAYVVATPAELVEQALDPGVPWHVSLIDVSAAGDAVLGNAEYAGGSGFGYSFRWDAADGFGPFSLHRIVAGSDDLSVLGGYEVEGDREAVRLAASTTSLGVGRPFDVSDTGAAVVGWIYDDAFEMESAFRWTAAGGVQLLGVLADDTDAHAQATSADGSIVVGRSGSESGGFQFHAAFVWDAENGMRPLQTVLEERLGVALESWTLLEAMDVSPDGRFVVGSARNGEGALEGFVADLPEPSPVLSGLAIAAALAALRRARPDRA